MIYIYFVCFGFEVITVTSSSLYNFSSNIEDLLGSCVKDKSANSKCVNASRPIGMIFTSFIFWSQEQVEQAGKGSGTHVLSFVQKHWYRARWLVCRVVALNCRDTLDRVSTAFDYQNGKVIDVA